jgi:asparagine synthase (glutamine-hydrolysing)
MCGVAGIVGSGLDSAESADRLKRMCAAIRRRGPDASGVSIGADAALGHQRLSIVDLAGGAQPMSSPGGDVVLVYNGEIFNHESIRRELERQGHRFSTRSDTEVLLNAYLQYGHACPERLRGMFAFAVWDARQRTLFMCRDRLGIKPLFYAQVGQSLVFGSEIKALLASGLVDDSLDPQAVDDYFAYGFIRSPRSIYRSIRSLLPGQTLTARLSNDGIELAFNQFWELPRGPAAASFTSYEDAKAELERHIHEAVKLRLISDVPIGAFLSGGIDSSTVVWAMSRAQGARAVQTFSIGFQEQSHDETAYARAVARRFQTDHHEETVTPDAISALPEVVHDFDEPFGDPSAIPTWYVCKMARRKVTVCLSGDGGDELFAGYRRYQAVSREWARGPSALSSLIGVAARFGAAESRLVNRAERGASTDFSRYYARFRNNYSPRMRELLYTPELRRAIDLEVTQDMFQRRAPHDHADGLARAQLADLQGYLSDDILVKLDRTSMAHSLEARVPLLDHELVTFVQSLPSDYKLRNGRSKAILVDLLEPHLPHEVLHRRKRGFSVPLSRWFRNELRERLLAALNGSALANGGLFRKDYLQRLYRLHQQGRVDLSFQLWQLLVFDEWSRSRPSLPRP